MLVGIAGAGGIGSNVAVLLLRSGIRDFVIADFDRIEPSNLNRQFYFADQVGKLKAPTLAENLRRIDPLVRVETAVTRLDATNMAAFFHDAEVVVEGFDGAKDKKILLETLARSHKLMVSASGVAGLELDHTEIRRVGNCHVVGDFHTEAGTDNLYAPKVHLVAAMMSGIVLTHYLSGENS